RRALDAGHLRRTRVITRRRHLPAVARRAALYRSDLRERRARGARRSGPRFAAGRTVRRRRDDDDGRVPGSATPRSQRQSFNGGWPPRVRRAMTWTEMVDPQRVSAPDAAECEPVGDGNGAYLDAWDHLRDELRRLDLRLSVRARHERRRPDSPLDALRGLVGSAEDAQGTLDELAAPLQPADADDDATGESERLRQVDQRIAARLAASANPASYLPLVRLAHLCQLTTFEVQCLVICAAPELDRR